MQQAVGQNLMGNLTAPVKNSIGDMLKQVIGQNPIKMAENFLGNIGKKVLGNIGQKLGIPGLGKGANMKDIANNLLGELKNRGTQFFKDKVMGGVKNFFNNKILSPVQGKLTEWGKGLLNKVGSPLLKKAGGKLLDFIGGSKLGQLGGKFLDKIGGKVLDKMGGFGKIASGALSLLNGKLDTKKLLQMGMNFIPGVGPLLSGLSAIPGVGKIFDKVLGGVAKVIEKIPGVGALVKGLGKVGGVIGKGVGKVVDGVKKVGKKLLGGVKKIGSKIAGGIKKVFKGW
jgi:hypothetical protein